VQHALEKASLNRTTIAIAHRLSTIQHADKIVVMNHRCLLEEGTHEELMAKPSGRYQRLFSLQMLSAAGNTDADDLEDSPVSCGKKPNFSAEIDTDSERNLVNKTSQKHRSHTANALTTFFRTMYEQRYHWIAYSVLFVGCLGGG
jgi:ABC-type dipeptide/oligopeptide/nickel transport system ATPase component